MLYILHTYTVLLAVATHIHIFSCVNISVDKQYSAITQQLNVCYTSAWLAVYIIHNYILCIGTSKPLLYMQICNFYSLWYIHIDKFFTGWDGLFSSLDIATTYGYNFPWNLLLNFLYILTCYTYLRSSWLFIILEFCAKQHEC